MLIYVPALRPAAGEPSVTFKGKQEALSRLIYASKRVCVCSGCRGEWDNVSCWQSAAVGEVMTLPCPSPLLHLFGKNGECLFRSGAHVCV